MVSTSRTRAGCILGSSMIFLLCLLIAPSLSSAQLAAANWIENISVSADSQQDLGLGSDEEVPEPVGASLSGSSYNIQGDISFSSPGPPNTTASISAEYVSGLGVFLGGTAVSRITFSFRVMETSPPPISVSSVPIIVSASGTANAGGDAAMFSSALSTFSVWITGETLASWNAVASNPQGPGADAFDETVQLDFTPGFGANVELSAGANVGAEVLQPNTSSSATAFVDPVLVIADELIPNGGGARYPDHYQIELSPGFWALGQTPVNPTTWGAIKRLFLR